MISFEVETLRAVGQGGEETYRQYHLVDKLGANWEGCFI